MVVKAVEALPPVKRHPMITPELMAEIRQQMGTRFQPQG